MKNEHTTALPYPPIGYLHSPFTEKFGVPRQSLMVKEARGVLKLLPDAQFRDAFRTLEQFSHVWLIFVFHNHLEQDWSPLISPPRIDAPKKVGVFASRSPHRPNPLGLSAVKLEQIDFEAKNGIEIHLSGIDLLDGTPVLDLKPYLPYVDSIPEARGGWAESEIPHYPVSFSETALTQIQNHENKNLKLLIEQMLSLDPRPTSQRKTMPIEDPAFEAYSFAFRLLDFDVQWKIRNRGVWVEALILLK